MKENDNRSRAGKYAPALVFIIFIFGMAVWFLLNPKLDYSSSEKRYLQKFPSTSFESISSGKFGSEFESYFADHFPERNVWVGLNAYYNLCLGNNGASGVYSCADNYLINHPVPKKNNIEKNTKIIAEFAQNTDVPVSVMLAPSTGYIESDVLPAFHDSYNDDEYFEQIGKTLKDSADFVDLRETFKKAKNSGEQLYYRTDHHWTTLGAYRAYQQLCESLGVEAAKQDDFKVEKHGGFYGTTYSTSGFWLTPPDEIELWRNEKAEQGISVKITEGNDTKEYSSMYFEKHLGEDDKYPVFIDGNHALTEITNKNAKGGTLLVIKDSFSHCAAPFLAENYSRVILVDMRYYKLKVSDLVKSEAPEQILVLYGIDNLATETDIAWLE